MSENERKEEAPTNQDQYGAAVEVTPEMVEAGVRVLAASGLEDVLEGADRLLVEEIYRAMSVLAPRPSERSEPGIES